jgi:hypothetical protein
VLNPNQVDVKLALNHPLGNSAPSGSDIDYDTCRSFISSASRPEHAARFSMSDTVAQKIQASFVEQRRRVTVGSETPTVTADEAEEVLKRRMMIARYATCIA